MNFRPTKQSIILGLAVLLIVITGVLILTNSSGLSFSLANFGLGKSPKALADQSVEYLNKNVLQDGQTATLVSYAKESGVVKLTLTIGGSNYDSYVTLDGKLFFPEAIKMDSKDSSTSSSPTASGSPTSFDIKDTDHIRGNVNAPVTLVEFSDFECPFCEKHYATIEKILKDYPDQVRLVYKHFPLTSIHPSAQKAAEASECASEQGKFWEYYDKLFQNQPGGLSTDKFKQWAKDLGLNSSQFNSCLDSSKYASKVKADADEGSSKGVTGTPATFVNGDMVSGALPYDTFKQKIDTILAGK